MNNKKFEEICKKNQIQLKEYVYNELLKYYKDVIKDDGFVFAKGTFPVLLVAHLDTVHYYTPLEIVRSDNGIWYSDEGIGGDDRCGVYMILEIIKSFPCSVIFCEDEEIGRIGAEKFCNSKFSKGLSFNYAIELDRRGSNDAVFYNCQNTYFEDFILQDFYKFARGSYSDISTLCPHLDIAGVNLSCGYYNAHTLQEYVDEKEMDSSINAVLSILNRTNLDRKFKFIEE